MRVRFSAGTHVGMRREVNQDSYDCKQSDRATLLVVCDGMGGHAAGEVASRIGVETIIATYSAEQPPEDSLRQAFVTANQRIYSEGHGSMGTTGVAALFLNDTLYVANVGDSRAYVVREGQIRQISRDHSFVSDQVAAGLMTPEQARASNIRNIITRALGHTTDVTVDLFTEEPRAGDTVLLSSDGMHGLITDEEIAEMAGVLPLDEVAQHLIDLANERGGPDNITVVIAQVDELDNPDKSSRVPATAPLPQQPPPTDPRERPLSRMSLGLSVLVLVSLIGLGLGIVWVRSAPTTLGSPTSLTPTVDLTASSTMTMLSTTAPGLVVTNTVVPDLTATGTTVASSPTVVTPSPTVVTNAVPETIGTSMAPPIPTSVDLANPALPPSAHPPIPEPPSPVSKP